MTRFPFSLRNIRGSKNNHKNEDKSVELFINLSLQCMESLLDTATLNPQKGQENTLTLLLARLEVINHEHNLNLDPRVLYALLERINQKFDLGIEIDPANPGHYITNIVDRLFDIQAGGERDEPKAQLSLSDYIDIGGYFAEGAAINENNELNNSAESESEMVGPSSGESLDEDNTQEPNTSMETMDSLNESDKREEQEGIEPEDDKYGQAQTDVKETGSNSFSEEEFKEDEEHTSDTELEMKSADNALEDKIEPLDDEEPVHPSSSMEALEDSDMQESNKESFISAKEDTALNEETDESEDTDENSSTEVGEDETQEINNYIRDDHTEGRYIKLAEILNPDPSRDENADQEESTQASEIVDGTENIDVGGYNATTEDIPDENAEELEGGSTSFIGAFHNFIFS